MTLLSLKSLYQKFILGFVLFWIVFLFLDYWKSHRAYNLSFENFQHGGLSVLFLLLAGGLTLGILWLKKRKKALGFVNGLSIGFLSLLLIILTSSSVFNKMNAVPTLSADGTLVMITRVIFIQLAILLFIVTPAFNIGEWVRKSLKAKLLPREAPIINIAIGLVFLAFLVFLLGSLGLLHAWLFYPLLIGILGVFWRSSLKFIKSTLWTPLSINKELNAIGIISFFAILLFISLNFIQIVRPYPLGFDALSLYMNLPSLIFNQEALIEGYQPYNWSLIMSLGYILFKKAEFALALSFLGGVLSVLALFKLSRRWLNVNYSLLTALLFYSLPAVNFQSFKDMKIDLGLLFITLCIVMLFIEWLAQSIGSKPSKTIEKTDRSLNLSFFQEYNLIILMGILSGFALGIKFTAVFVLIAIVGGIWYAKAGKLAFLAAFCLGMFVILILKIDDISGLRAYHLGANILQWVLLGLGLTFTAITFIRNKKALFDCLKISTIYALFCILVFLPWPIKNFSETKSLNPQTLLFGEPPGARIGLQQFQQNYEQLKNGN